VVRSITVALILVSVSSFAHVVNRTSPTLRISGSDIVQKLSPNGSGLNDSEGCELKIEKSGARRIDCLWIDYAHYDRHENSINLVEGDIVEYKSVNGGDCFEMSGPTAKRLTNKLIEEELASDNCYHYDFWKPIEDADKRRLELQKAAPPYVSDDPYH
jgi:hypothetical protein